MALAPQFTPFEVVDLRVVGPRALAPLLNEEERHWRKQLHWDYRPSAEMIRRHIQAHSLPGYVALQQGEPAGYCFFVYEDEKGLLGDLYVGEAYRRERPYGDRTGIATILLEHALETLEHTPVVRRIEAQLLPFDVEPLGPTFEAHRFDCFPRLFMYKELTPVRPGEGRRPAGSAARGAHPATGAELRPWQDEHFEAMADLIVDAYEGHVDSRLNDHYGSTAGAMRFLKNIVLFPGCGIFQAEASLVAIAPGGEGALLGAVLSSQVARRVAHITQICVRRTLQGSGLGRALLESALERLAGRGYQGVSLTVTASNGGAVQLYRRLGFDVIKEFAAYARNLR
jgi:ribosomal protein S18 acetylase RimI-like enzyme